MQTAPTDTNGWLARLDLTYEQRQGRTILAENSHCGPLRVQLPLYPEGDEVCQTCILHPPGGVVGGDELHIEVKTGPGAHALLTTPGATKFYRSAGREARQLQTLRVNGGVLEWFPQDNIVFPGADARIATDIYLDNKATFSGWEVLCLGLPTRGDCFTGGRLYSSIRLFRENRAIFVDRLRINREPDLKSPAGLRGYPVVATFLATGVEKELLEELRQLLPDRDPNFLAGLTLQHGLLVGRYLGQSTFHARTLMQKIWAHLRPAVIGRQACPPRIWST